MESIRGCSTQVCFSPRERPCDSPSLENPLKKGPSFSGAGHNLAPVSILGSLRWTPKRPPFEPVESVERKFLSLKTALLTPHFNQEGGGSADILSQ